MNPEGDAMIRFDDAGNLDLYGHNDILAQVFRSSERVGSFRRALTDFGTFAKCCPEMVAIVSELLPSMPQYVADLPAATLKLMEEGKLFLKTDKSGRLIATLAHSDTKRIHSHVRLKEASKVPAVSDMMFSLSFMAITQQLNDIQEGIAELRCAQVHDRETHAMVAAQNLQWASAESDPEKRAKLCSQAHDAALEGFFACLNTVEEHAGFFLAQPASASFAGAVASQVAPWNWGKSLRAIAQMQPMASGLQRSIAKCTYCAQYASASSFMVDDEAQAVRDLEMYAQHMSRAILGDKADHLRPWLSPKTLEALPLPRRLLTALTKGDLDILGYVEETVGRIEGIAEGRELPSGQPHDISDDDKESRKE